MKRHRLLLLLALPLAACDDGTHSASPDAGLPTADAQPAPDATAADAETAADAGAPGDAGPAPDIGPWEPHPAPAPYAQHVDPRIGTGGNAANVGQAYPGAAAPFGLVKASPDTGGEFGAVGFRHNAGYHAADREMYGISHNHLHGTGVPDYGNVLVTPTRGMAAEKTSTETFYVPFDLDSEAASPGYYAVDLEGGIRAEVTATTRCAHHRYTFTDGGEAPTLALNLGAALVDGRTRGGAITVDPVAGTLSGQTHNVGNFSGRYDGFPVFFAARVRQELSGFGTWADGELAEGRAQATTDADPAHLGAWLSFDDAVVEMQVCLSYVDVAGAEAALAAELPDWDLEATRAATEAAWEAELSRFEVWGAGPEQWTIFYTAIYHALQMPTIWTDVDGRYRGFDGEVHQADGWTYVTDLSMWDTFRTLHPLLTLVWPEWQLNSVRSLAAMRDEGGYIPKWAMGMGDTGSMIGQPGAIVIADSWLKGLTDFDIDTLYAGLVETASGPLPAGSYGARGCGAEYLEYGYCPADDRDGSVSITLELAYADHCIAELAAALDKPEAEQFAARATSQRNLFDPETGFYRPRMADGTWKGRFRPTDWHLGAGDYTEGTAWQWRWFAPHDIPWMLEAMGGVDAFVAELSTFFERAADNFTFEVPGSFYYHGNEPDLHAPFLFNDAGRPDLAQRWSRWALDANYRTDRGGIVGNDDAGTLAAWYVFVAAGLYPVPCEPGYALTRPRFEKVVVHLPGADVVVEAPGASAEDPPPMKPLWNGEELDDFWISHDALLEGGTLRFEPM